MKVLHVESGKHLYGGALQVCYLLKGLRTRCENILVCLKDSDIAHYFHEDQLANPGQEPIKVCETAIGGDLDVGFISRLKKIIAEEKPDLVHLHSRRGAEILGALAARSAKSPVILSRRVDNPEPDWIAKRKYKLYQHVITISEGIRQVLISEGVPAGHITCVPSAVDTQLYQANTAIDQDIYTLFDLPPNSKVLAIVAQLIQRKGHRYLFEALTEIIKAHPETRVVVLGKGPLEEALRTLCQEKGLAEYVHFAGFRNDLPQLLPQFYAVIHPADMEGLGVSLLQTAACEVPIVASAVGGIPEAVIDEHNGYLIDAGDINTLTNRTRRLLADPVLAKKMGQQGRKHIETHFSIEAMVNGNFGVYQKVIDSLKP